MKYISKVEENTHSKFNCGGGSKGTQRFEEEQQRPGPRKVDANQDLQTIFPIAIGSSIQLRFGRADNGRN
jgi:hypothetical protein